MKKLLALVLALVMVMGLATVGANAAVYSDANDIDYAEAVDVMSALGVFDGMDGKFNPKGTLTREQGAKIISYMILGKKAADSLSTAGAPFDDVASDRWSAGAIAYCTSEKIIGGVGGNKFNPEGELTGYAFAKMLLVALGYNPEVEGLVGDSWSINTAKLAISAGLKDKLGDLVMGTGITREEACQMAFNTEKADLVQYPNNTVIQTGDVTVTSTSKADTIAYANAKDYRLEERGADNGDTVKQFCEEYASDLQLRNTNADDFGRPSNNWWNDKTEIGTYSSAADYTYSGKVTRGTLYADLGKSAVENLYAKGGTSLTVYVDGVKIVDAQSVAADADADAVAAAKAVVLTYFDKSNSSAAGVNSDGDPRNWGATGNGSSTEMYVDKGNATIVIINEYLVQADADYNANTKKLSVSTPANASSYNSYGTEEDDAGTAFVAEKLSSDDFAVTEVKKDDFLIVTVAAGERSIPTPPARTSPSTARSTAMSPTSAPIPRRERPPTTPLVRTPPSSSTRTTTSFTSRTRFPTATGSSSAKLIMTAS